MLTVSDTGRSDPTEKNSKIFSPCFSTNWVGRGKGKDLSVVHGVVLSPGGNIKLKRKVGRGAKFRICLPVSDENVKSATVQNTPDSVALSEERKKVLAGVHVMVVDDEPALSEMLEVLLKNYGAKVSAFNNPSLALDFFVENPGSLDIVVSDETMPLLSGLVLSKKIRRIRELVVRERRYEKESYEKES